MTTDYRALCDELKDAYAWCLEECMRAPAKEDTLIQRARAALALPAPAGPTDAALIKMWATASYIDQPEGGLAFARAVLARYGGSTSNSTED